MFNPRNYFDREITKDIYNRAMKNGGYLTKEDEERVLTTAERCGYGATAGSVKESGGRYYVSCHIYDSCD